LFTNTIFQCTTGAYIFLPPRVKNISRCQLEKYEKRQGKGKEKEKMGSKRIK
jgi:hypothetical protein